MFLKQISILSLLVASFSACQQDIQLFSNLEGSLQELNHICNHAEASNYRPGTVAETKSEDCLFLICTDQDKEGFKIRKFTEYQSYVREYGGVIQNSDELCGDDKLTFSGRDIPFPAGHEQYHTYQEFIDEVNVMTQGSNGYARKEIIGTSSEGLPLVAIRVSANLVNPKEQKSMVIVGTHHAREHLATEIPLLMARDFIEKLKNSASLRATMESRTIYFIPLLNPDGARYDLQNGSFQFWRKNTRVAVANSGARGVDLNRNYDNYFNQGGSSTDPNNETYHGPSPFSETETKSFRDFLAGLKNYVTFVLSYHSFAELVLYPYAGTQGNVPANDLLDFKAIAGQMASITGYTPMKASDLYLSSGEACDWVYDSLKIFCMTIELTPHSSSNLSDFYPPGSIISGVLAKNNQVLDYLLTIMSNPRAVVNP